MCQMFSASAESILKNLMESFMGPNPSTMLGNLLGYSTVDESVDEAADEVVEKANKRAKRRKLKQKKNKRRKLSKRHKSNSKLFIGQDDEKARQLVEKELAYLNAISHLLEAPPHTCDMIVYVIRKAIRIGNKLDLAQATSLLQDILVVIEDFRDELEKHDCGQVDFPNGRIEFAPRTALFHFADETGDRELEDIDKIFKRIGPPYKGSVKRRVNEKGLDDDDDYVNVSSEMIDGGEPKDEI